ncbi:DUF947-domain-containing protein [Rhizoclosmatium globosum]|uniref:rRNA biogenesis protein RRP36 n=1 Tax=Rhizoclosmatium globosum TaxID=329046 RepID=A0A1Y2ASZ2_9FUNG|nr:DUF947-domain-containing protein [Rhizoclosmatium globosum]|eukprot:ORY25672.1 DUF947-domain-containing protein [Rhizoclosmatium globosum]
MRKGMSIQRNDEDDPNVIYGSDSDDSGPESGSNLKGGREAREKKEIKKRTSKHAPAEMTSKRPVPRYRQVVELPKKEEHRDPRFNKFSGKFNEGLFKRSYGFLEDTKRTKLKSCERRWSRRKIPLKKKSWSLSKQIQKQKEEKQKNIQRQWKKSEMEAVKQGKKAFYLKKSDKEKLALYEQYKKLGEGKGVDKFLEKRRKKNSASEKRFLPNARR